MSSAERGPQIGPRLSVIHSALVSGFQNYPLSVVDARTGKPKVLSASNTITASVSGGIYPFLAFKTGSFSLTPWKDLQYSIAWDIPARLTVQGPGEDGEASMRDILLDVLIRTNELMGLPIDSRGETVAFGDDTLALFDKGELNFLCERGAPYIKSVNVTGVDDGLCVADIVFHIESTLNLDPRTLKLMKVGVLGVNAVPPDGLFQDTTATDGRGIALVFGTSDERGFGGYNSQDPDFSKYPLSGPLNRQNTSQVAGLRPSEIPTSVNVTPYSASISAGSPTSQLTAIALYADFHSTYVTSTASWSSSNASVATVNSSGLVTRVAAGSCTISCTFSGVASNSVAVTAT